MEERSANSSSPIKDDDEEKQSDFVSKADYQLCLAKIKSLSECNSNLKQAMDGMQNQLDEALRTADTYKSCADQLNELQQKLETVTASRDDLAKQLQPNADSQSNQLPQVIEERDEALSIIQTLRDQQKASKSDLKEANSQNEELQATVNSLLEKNQKLKSKCKQLKRKSEILLQQHKEATSRASSLALSLQKCANEKTILEEDNASLKLQQDSLSSIQPEPEIQTKESLAKESLMNLIEDQLGNQRDEIASLSSDRKKLVDLLRLSQSYIISSEAIIDSSQKEIERIKSSQPKYEARAKQLLSIPFSGDLLSEAQRILALTQYEPEQKAQLIVNEAARRIEDLESEIEESSNHITDLEEKITTSEKASQILNSLLRDLKTIIVPSDRMNPSLLCKDDQKFIDFLSESTDFSQARGAITNQGSVFDLYISQFFVNSLLKSKSEKKPEPKDDKDKIEKLNIELRKMKDAIQTLKKKLEASDQSLASAIAEKESAQNEITVLNLKEKMLQNSISIMERERNFTPKVEAPNSNDDTLLQKIKQLEQKLDEERASRDEERANDAEEYECLRKSAKKAEKEARKILEQKDSELATQQKIIEEKLKELKREKKSLRGEYEKMLDDSKEEFANSQECISRTLDEMKQRASDARATSAQLSEELSSCERKMQNMQAEYNQLLLRNKNLELNFSQAKQKFIKEKMEAEGRASAALMSNEERSRTSIQQLSRQYEARIRAVLASVIEIIGKFYGYSSTEIDEDGVKKLMVKVRSDLDKLAVFQSESLKFVRSA